MKYSIVILVSATKQWLRLSRKERNEFSEQTLMPILLQYKETLSIRMFDAENFNAKHSDFVIIETSHLDYYYHFWEQIRDSKIYTAPYFIINEIIVGREDAFKDYEKSIGMR